MIIDAKFRKLMLEAPQIVRDSVLTVRQVEIVKYVNAKGTVRSGDIADAFGISLGNASAQLRRLSDKGYLGRVQYAAPSGGLEYEYYGVLV